MFPGLDVEINLIGIYMEFSKTCSNQDGILFWENLCKAKELKYMHCEKRSFDVHDVCVCEMVSKESLKYNKFFIN